MKWLFVFGLLVVVSVESRSVVEPQNNIEYIIAEKQESMTTIELIEYWGYPAEEHNAITDDGYILALHRIPYGKSGPTGKRPIIFLQHGLEDSSAGWVVNYPNKSAAFIFADNGFDVWLGNMRGNTYTKDHLTLDPKSHEFWSFSFDEMVQYDLINTLINYVLKTTGQTDLYYVGHSQGTLTMFSKLSRNPEFGKKIKKFFALAPVGTVKYIKGLIEAVSGKYVDILSWYFDWYGESEFIPTDWIISIIGEYICRGIGGRFCDYFVMLIFGVDSNQLNSARTSVYMGHIPAGTSTRNFIHWSQMVKTGLLCEYDFGNNKDNIVHYGQSTAPVYDITAIDPATKMYLFWSPSDWLADQRDVTDFLLTNLPPTTVVQNNMLKDFNHVDFLWGEKAADQVYTPILNVIKQDFAMGNRATRERRSSQVPTTSNNGEDNNERTITDTEILHLLNQNALVGIFRGIMERNDVNKILRSASQDGHLDIVKDIIEKGNVDINSIDEEDGWTALHLAAYNAHASIVQLLIQNGAEVNSVNFDMNTPLHLASGNATPDVLQVLISNGAKIDAKGINDATALHVASYSNQVDNARKLIELKSDVNARAVNELTCLHLAAEYGDVQMIRLLLANNAQLEARNDNGATALHVAIEESKIENANELIKNGADVKAQTESKQTPLHCAAKTNNVDLIKLLLEKGAQVDAKNEMGYTALHSSVLSNQLDSARKLIECNADVNVQSNTGITPLHLTCKVEDLEFIDLLIKHGALINAKENHGFTILHSVAQFNELDKARKLLKLGADINVANCDLNTPLHLAAQQAGVDMIQFLVENNAQLESKGVAGFTVLHSAIYFNSNNIEIVRKLIELKADINAQTTNEWTALHLAAMKAGTQLLQLLLDNGAKLEVRDDSGLTPLHHAVSSNKLENTKWFISKGSIEFANIKSVEKWTALHLAAEYGDSEMVKLLVEAGIELEATDYFGRTSLHFAVMSNSYENAKTLIANGANVNSQGGCENTPLHYAVRIGSSKLVRLLVEARADTSIKNRDGLTPSQMASKLNYPGISHLLLNEEDSTSNPTNQPPVINNVPAQSGPPVTDSQTSEDEKLVDSFYRFGERFSSILSQNVQLKNENLGLRNDVEKIVDELNLMSAKFSSVEDSGRDLSKENLDYAMLLRALEKNMIEDGGASTSSASNEPPNTTRMTCRICLDNLANCAVIVCGHLCLCDECSVGWQENLQSCPCCRQSIEAIVKIII